MIDALTAASDRIDAAGAQLRDEVAAAVTSDDYGVLDSAPRVCQLFVDMEAQLRSLVQQAAAASGPAGCVSALQLKDGAKAAALSGFAQLGAVTQQRTQLAHGQSVAINPVVASLRTKVTHSQSAAVQPIVRPIFCPSSLLPSPFRIPSPVPNAVRPMQHLDSRVLPAASESTLLRFFGGTPVGHSSTTVARQWAGNS